MEETPSRHKLIYTETIHKHLKKKREKKKREWTQETRIK